MRGTRNNEPLSHCSRNSACELVLLVNPTDSSPESLSFAAIRHFFFASLVTAIHLDSKLRDLLGCLSVEVISRCVHAVSLLWCSYNAVETYLELQKTA